MINKNAVIYIRVSNKEQDEERQIKDAEYYVKDNGINLKKTFIEKISGYKIDYNKRSELSELIDDTRDKLATEQIKRVRDTRQIKESVKTSKIVSGLQTAAVKDLQENLGNTKDTIEKRMLRLENITLQSVKAIGEIATWVMEGKIQHREDIQEGIENCPQTLNRLFKGENKGKQLLKI